MFLNEAKTHIERLLGDTMPIMLMGAPGIGKSSIVKQIAKDKDLQVTDLRLSLLNPLDLRGMPYLDKEKMQAVWLPPEFLPKKGDKPGILFMDEINIAPVATQQAAYELLLDRRIGNYIFPDNWRIVAAGNREEDGAQVNSMPTPLANRMIHLEVQAELDDWKGWAIKSGINEKVIAFLGFKPDLLATLPKKEEKAFPTPRSWEFVSRALALYNEDIDEVEPIIEGTIGKGAAKEFLAYMKVYKDLPDIDGILAGKVTKVPAKTRSDILFALCSSLVTRLKKENLEHFIAYTLNLDPEWSTLAVRDAAKGGWSEDMAPLPVWDTWSKKFGEYLD